jgi:hypothetical protein
LVKGAEDRSAGKSKLRENAETPSEIDTDFHVARLSSSQVIGVVRDRGEASSA